MLEALLWKLMVLNCGFSNYTNKINKIQHVLDDNIFLIVIQMKMLKVPLWIMQTTLRVTRVSLSSTKCFNSFFFFNRSSSVYLSFNSSLEILHKFWTLISYSFWIFFVIFDKRNSDQLLQERVGCEIYCKLLHLFMVTLFTDSGQVS